MTTFKKFSAISASILMLTAVTLTSLNVTSAFAAESPTQSVDEANAYKVTSVSLNTDNGKMISTSSTAGTYKKGYDFHTNVTIKINGTKQSKDIVYIQTCKNDTQNWIIRAERQ